MITKLYKAKIRRILRNIILILITAGLISGNTVLLIEGKADELATQSLFKTMSYPGKEDMGKIEYFLTCVSGAFLVSKEIKRDINIKLKEAGINLDLRFSERQYVEPTGGTNKRNMILPCVLNGKKYYSYISYEADGKIPEVSVITEKAYLEAVSKNIFFSEKETDINSQPDKKTGAYQIIKLSDGRKVQFGVPTETTKEIMKLEIKEGQRPPDIFVLPEELFHDGRNYADIEFVIYYNFYIKHKRRITIVGTEEQIENLKIYMQHSLYGPDQETEAFKKYDKDVQKFLKTALAVYSEQEKEGKSLGLEEYINFISFKNGKAKVNGTCEILTSGSNVFSIKDRGRSVSPREIKVDYRAPESKIPRISLEKKKKFLSVPNKSFAITPLGTSHGFDLEGDFTSFIIWLDGTGIMVDPSPQALGYIDALGIDDDMMPYVYLTHTHADHDGGLLRKILSKRKIKLMSSRPVYDSFIAKVRVLVGKEYDVENWVDYVEIKPGEENALKLVLPNGEKAVIRSRYNLHSIPTNGFKVTYKGSVFGYSGDTEYNEKKIKKLLNEDRITAAQARDLLYFFWDNNGGPLVDILFHEAGVPPIHTPADTIAAFPEKIKERTYLVHIADKDVPKKKSLRKAEAFETYTLIGEDARAQEERIKRIVETASLGMPGVTEQQKDTICRNAKIRTYEPGKYIIKEGDPITKDSEYYIVLSGNVEFYQDGIKIGEAGRGASFGEIGLVRGVPRMASVVTKDNAELLCLSREKYFSVFSKKDREYQVQCEIDNLRTIELCFERLSGMGKKAQNISDDEIGEVPYFVIKKMTMLVESEKFNKGEKISGAEEEEDYLYILKTGAVDIFVSQGEKKLVIQRLEKEGDLFGGRAFVDDDNRKYENVEAAEDTEILVVNRKQIVDLMKECPGAAYVLSKLSKKRSLLLESKKNGKGAGETKKVTGKIIERQQKNAANEIIRAVNNLVINTGQDKRILLALDDGLAGNFQNINLTSIITAIMEILDSKDCPDIVKNKILVIRGRGISLTDEVLKYTGKEGNNDIKVDPSDVIMVTKDTAGQKARCSRLFPEATITFVDEEALDEFSYYPFLEVVFYSLARALHNKEITGYTKDLLEEIFTAINADISGSMDITDNMVVIKLKPIKPEDYSELPKLYDRVRRFLKAA